MNIDSAIDIGVIVFNLKQCSARVAVRANCTLEIIKLAFKYLDAYTLEKLNKAFPSPS